MFDDQIDIIADGDDTGTTIGMSWVAYTRLIPVCAVCIAALVAVAYFLGERYFRERSFYVAVILALLWIYYELAYIQSKKLLINGTGVWYFCGILPWRKTSNGIQWRNLGVVSYRNSFMTYITKSYTIQISDRYSEKVVLSVDNLQNGQFILTKINAILSEKEAAQFKKQSEPIEVAA